MRRELINQPHPGTLDETPTTGDVITQFFPLADEFADLVELFETGRKVATYIGGLSGRKICF
jgi:hypothetical protein